MSCAHRQTVIAFYLVKGLCLCDVGSDGVCLFFDIKFSRPSHDRSIMSYSTSCVNQIWLGCFCRPEAKSQTKGVFTEPFRDSFQIIKYDKIKEDFEWHQGWQRESLTVWANTGSSTNLLYVFKKKLCGLGLQHSFMITQLLHFKHNPREAQIASVFTEVASGAIRFGSCIRSSLSVSDRQSICWLSCLCKDRLMVIFNSC